MRFCAHFLIFKTGIKVNIYIKGDIDLKKISKSILIYMCLIMLLSGCASNNDNSTNNSEHEPITMAYAYQGASAFLALVHEKYPEVNLVLEPYSGANTTQYITEAFEYGELPDIVMRSYYSPDRDDVSDLMLDMSSYSFTDNYLPARIKEVSDNGAIYFLPQYYTCIGITYNKTLLEENGWELPTSFKELEELAPKVIAAGYNLCLNQVQYPGYGFQYLFNIADTGYLSTIDGRKWQSGYLNGTVLLSESEEMMESLSMIEKWRDIGMLNGNGNPVDDTDTRNIMSEGNTLFMLGSTNGIIGNEELSDEFSIMPYLSMDGDQNTYIMSVDRYYGINKKLSLEGNEQKLEDALKIMELLSTEEGMRALMGESRFKASLLPLSDYEVLEDNYYYAIKDEIDSGNTAPLIYTGWENCAVEVGEAMLSYMKGEAEFNDIVEAFDTMQDAVVNNTPEVYATVEEEMSYEDVARLIGISFGKAADVDISLISLNKYIESGPDNQNTVGISRKLFKGQIVSEQTISSFVPTGWYGTIQVMTASGKRIKELAQIGFERFHLDETYPYVLVTKDGFEIDDDTIYKIVVSAATTEVGEECGIEDTGIIGLKAVEEYLSNYDTISGNNLKWE